MKIHHEDEIQFLCLRDDRRAKQSNPDPVWDNFGWLDCEHRDAGHGCSLTVPKGGLSRAFQPPG
jgi:hypothetical protein